MVISLGFRRLKETRYAIGMLRIIAERNLEIDEKLCAFFTNWQKVSDLVKWTEFMKILKETGIGWRKSE